MEERGDSFSPHSAHAQAAANGKPRRYVDVTVAEECGDSGGPGAADSKGANGGNGGAFVGAADREGDKGTVILAALQSISEKIISSGGELYSTHFSSGCDDEMSHVAVAPDDSDSLDSFEGSEDKLLIEDSMGADIKDSDYRGTSSAGRGSVDRENDTKVEVTRTDRYGFKISELNPSSDLSRQGVALSASQVEARKAKEGERLKKWIKMIKRWNFTVSNRREKLKRRIRKGIPDAVRGKVWVDLLSSEANKWRGSHSIRRLNDMISSGVVSPQVMEEIEKDVDRTFPNHVMFESKEKRGQHSLRTVLTWYAALDVEVGYCQGMGFLAALFLTYMTEEDAFYCLVAVLNRPEAPFRYMYCPGMEAVKKFLSVFGDLGRFYLPKLWGHFEGENVHQSMFLTEWIMTVFSRNFSFEFVTRVWDMFLYEGMKILYRVCLGLLKCIEEEALQTDFEQIMNLIRTIPQVIDVERAVDAAWSIPLRRSKIDEFNIEYDKST